MDRDTIIRLAREAGAVFPADGSWHRFEDDGSLERFAALVAAHEREECAKVCDAVDSLIGAIESVGMQAGARKVLTKACEDAASVAAAIRSRT